MPVTYSPAPEVDKIGRQLIAKHHPALLDERVEFVFRSEAAKSGGRTVWGKARKISGLNAFLSTRPGPVEEAADELRKSIAKAGGGSVSAGGKKVDVPADAETSEDQEIDPYFVIELAKDVWDIITGKQRVALVDHELSHCRVAVNHAGKPALTVVAHDVEEFEAVIRRHGLWKSDVKHFAKVTLDAVGGDQMSLLGDDSDQD